VKVSRTDALLIVFSETVILVSSFTGVIIGSFILLIQKFFPKGSGGWKILIRQGTPECVDGIGNYLDLIWLHPNQVDAVIRDELEIFTAPRSYKKPRILTF
jgi:hypothetical protein